MDFTSLILLVGKPFLFTLFGFAGLLGLIALCSPRVFKLVATQLERTVDTQKLAAALEKKTIHFDGFLLRHVRLLGAAVVTVVACLGIIYLSV